MLVEPPFYRLFKETLALERYPLGLAYLGGEIRKKSDWQVMVYNADFQPHSESFKVSYLSGVGFNNYIQNLKDLSGHIWTEVARSIEEFRPTVVGISAKSQNFTSALNVARLVKRLDPDILVIMGGPHPSMVGEDLLKHPEIDISVVGEGEVTLNEVLTALGSGATVEGIPGIIHRKEGRVLRSPPRGLLSDLDSLCFPHTHAPEILKDYEKYPIAAFRNIFAIRGCPYNCFFCGSRNIWSRRVRFRSPGSVVAEINSLRARGVQVVHFDDDTFGVTDRHLADLCHAIKQNCPGLLWDCEIPVPLVKRENLALMQEAGCFCISIGIESGNNQILAALGKKNTIEDAVAACELITSYGFELNAFFIVGYPQDTEATLRDTINVMRDLKCYSVIYSIFTPYPGTDAFRYCKENGLIGDDFDVSLYNHQSPANNFCKNISKERFRQLVDEIEKQLDGKNLRNRLKRLLTPSTFKRIQELGFTESVKKGLRIFMGR